MTPKEACRAVQGNREQARKEHEKKKKDLFKDTEFRIGDSLENHVYFSLGKVLSLWTIYIQYNSSLGNYMKTYDITIDDIKKEYVGFEVFEDKNIFGKLKGFTIFWDCEYD